MIDASWYTRPKGVEESVAAGGVVARVSGSDILIAVAKEKSYESAVLPSVSCTMQKAGWRLSRTVK